MLWSLFFPTVLLPLIVTGLLWRWPRRPLGGWIGIFACALGVTGFSLLAAPWGWFGLGVRALLFVVFVIAAIASFRAPLPAEPAPERPIRVLLMLLVGLMFGSAALGVLRAHIVPDGAIELRFPLHHGAYLIGHGGSHPAANTHAISPQQRYALDIVKLNAFGMRASGIYPSDLTRYAIFNDAIYSPCDGVVLATRDGVDDNAPGTVEEKYPEGNYVTVRCGDANVLLAHMRRGSVAVQPNARVTTTTLLGHVGNSGRTTEPHLHIHAERNGIGVGAKFDGRWLVRNAIVRR
jgi:hypothetical protein